MQISLGPYKECGGASICEHGRRKATCKECGGSEICEHGKIKSTCKEYVMDLRYAKITEQSMTKVSHGAAICIHKKM